MANIVLNKLTYEYKGRRVQTYAESVAREIRAQGHNVIEVVPMDLSRYDLLLDLDCGRDDKGHLSFLSGKTSIPSAVWFIDSHGHPEMHQKLAPNYNHVFFAVWDKRDLFTDHPSSHWCPNATDMEWFHPGLKPDDDPRFDFGFFGSKKGLDRTFKLKNICFENQWSCDIRQICPPNKHRWPYTGEAMANCKILFNHGQKHDGPNLRVMESMALNIPLISDQDHRSGMDKLFEPWTHYLPYEAYTYSGLKYTMEYAMSHYSDAEDVAEEAFNEVKAKHLIKHRVAQILEVCLG